MKINVKNKFNVTVEALIVAGLVLLGILSALNKFDVPFYFFVIGGVGYYVSEIMGWSERTVNPNSPPPTDKPGSKTVNPNSNPPKDKPKG